MRTDADDERFKSELVALIPRLRAFARALSRSDAAGDDLAQDTVLSAWRARAGFELGTKMEAWLFRILRNAHISGARLKARRPEHALDPSVDELQAVDDPSAGVRLNDLRRALNRLPPDQREALILVGASGWSYEEAAAASGCPVGTMKSRVFRARRNLSNALDSGRVVRDAVPAGEALTHLTGMIKDHVERRRL